MWIGDRCVPVEGKCEFMGNVLAPGVVTFGRASAKLDRTLLEQLEKLMHPPYPTGTMTRVTDSRVWPYLIADYRNDDLVVPVSYPETDPEGLIVKYERPSVAPLKAASAFLSSLANGGEETTTSLVAPNSPARGQLAKLRQVIGDASGVKAESAHTAADDVVVLTTAIPVKPDLAAKAPVLLRLTRHGERWMVQKIDVRLEEPITRRLTDVLGNTTQSSVPPEQDKPRSQG
jgi:hypothetical protein